MALRARLPRVRASTTTRARPRRGSTVAPVDRARARARASEDEDGGAPSSTSTGDPFGFGDARNQGPTPIVPGFDTAEGGKVGPVGTAVISLVLFVLFGGSFFFTSVPRGAVEEMARAALADDPNAPTNVVSRV